MYMNSNKHRIIHRNSATMQNLEEQNQKKAGLEQPLNENQVVSDQLQGRPIDSQILVKKHSGQWKYHPNQNKGSISMQNNPQNQNYQGQMSNYYPTNSYYRQQRPRGGFHQTHGRGRGQRVDNYYQAKGVMPIAHQSQATRGVVQQTPMIKAQVDQASSPPVAGAADIAQIQGTTNQIGDINAQPFLYQNPNLYHMEMHENLQPGQIQGDPRYNRFYPVGARYFTDHMPQGFEYNQYYHPQIGNMQHQYSRPHTGHQIHHRSRGRGIFPSSRGRGNFRGSMNSHHGREIQSRYHEAEMYMEDQYYMPYEPVYYDPYMPPQYSQPHQFQQQKDPFMVPKRQFGTNATKAKFERDDEVYMDEENKEIHNNMQAQPLTNASRVLRRGRGQRNDNENTIGYDLRKFLGLPDKECAEPNSNKHNNQEETKSQLQSGFHQNDEQIKNTQHKIVSRQGGRGHRGGFNNGNNNQRIRPEMSQMYPESFSYPQNMGDTNQERSHRVEEFSGNRGGRGPRKIKFHEGRRQDYSSNQPELESENNFEAAFESEHSNENLIPEYLRYDEFDEEETFAPKPIKPVTYTQKTFDDDSNTMSSFEDDPSNGENYSQRRGPKIIKFKQKKHSERLAMSQLKNDSDQEKTDLIDLYTPKNKQDVSQIQILRRYKDFDLPEFFQGPQWKFVRPSTNQNSKQKHFENGEYDKVQYNFPGNEIEDKETDGELKLYPPIDDFSDEDHGMPTNIRAKVSFGLSPGDSAQKKIPQNLQNLISAADQNQKNRNKKPSFYNKQFVTDTPRNKKGWVSNFMVHSVEKIPITMDGAESFFLKEEAESKVSDEVEDYFESYITDEKIIKENLESGVFFKGILKGNSKFKNKAWVNIPEFDIDVMIRSFNHINRTLDGDTVLIKLMPPHLWAEYSLQSVLNANITAIDKITGKQTIGLSALRQGTDKQNYTNETAIETRVIDSDSADGKAESNQLSPSQSEDDTKGILPNSIVSKKTKKSFQFDEEIEGYNASNSDNNFDLDKNKSRVRNQQLDIIKTNMETAKKLNFQSLTKINNDITKQASKLSRSSSEKDLNSLNEENIDKKMNMWEHLEQNIINKDDFVESLSNFSEKNANQEKINIGMSLKKFLGIGQIIKEESSQQLKELNGTRDEIIAFINSQKKQVRPVGKIVNLVKSPIRDQTHVCTLVEVEDTKKEQGNLAKTRVFAVPINEKMPWMIVEELPLQFNQDKFSNRNPSHRYYMVEIGEWTTKSQRSLCKVVEHIGEAGDLKAESLRILKKNEICTEDYDVNGVEAIHECLKVFVKKENLDPETNEWKIPEAEIKKRLDLRSKRIFSIDPITAKDIDDTLSIEKISDTIYEIGVHIADVSFFVPQGTDLDMEALKRGSSTYMVHKVFPMLPRLLSERLCSLHSNVERLAYSIFFRLDLSNGKIVKGFVPRITRSVIKSCAKWNYELVEDILDNKLQSEDQLEEGMRPRDHSFQELGQDCLMMNQVAQARRKDRMKNGSLEFKNRNFGFTLNENTQYPLAFQEQSKMKSKQLVEEFMLLANCLIAEHLQKYCKDKTILRAHNAIADEKREDLANYFTKNNLFIDMSTNTTLCQTINALKELENGEEIQQVVNRKFLSNIKQANYVCVNELEPQEYHHFGLNFESYTHFTSPIRRYADLLVHRLLTISLKKKEEARQAMEGLDYTEYANDISEKTYNAKRASMDCETLFHCLIIKDFGSKVFEALVFDVDYNQVSLYIHDLNIHVHLKVKDDKRVDETTFIEDDYSLTVSFRVPLKLASDIRQYDGETTLMMSKNQQHKIKMEQKNHGDIVKDEGILALAADLTKFLPKKSDESHHCVFKVFDKLKVKLTTSDSFPLKLDVKMLITEEDYEEYETVKAAQEIREQELAKIAKLDKGVNDQIESDI